MTVVGVDGCKKGWFAVELATDGTVTGHHVRMIGDLESVVPEVTIVAIDIPIGLPLGGRRAADIDAKKLLGARQNSVFFTAPRAVLEAVTHAEATAMSLDLTGVGLSQQSFALRSKIFEVEEWIAHCACAVFEVHPEVSFAEMLGTPARWPKSTWAGMVERRSALLGAGVNVDSLIPPATAFAGVDDVLDASVAAWSAHRIETGAARQIPPVTGPITQATIWI